MSLAQLCCCRSRRSQRRAGLLQAYDLYRKMEVLRPTPSTAQEMTKFHSNDYVAFMQNVRRCAPPTLRPPSTLPLLLGQPGAPCPLLAQVTPDNYQDAKFGTQLKRFSAFQASRSSATRAKDVLSEYAGWAPI